MGRPLSGDGLVLEWWLVTPSVVVLALERWRVTTKLGGWLGSGRASEKRQGVGSTRPSHIVLCCLHYLLHTSFQHFTQEFKGTRALFPRPSRALRPFQQIYSANLPSTAVSHIFIALPPSFANPGVHWQTFSLYATGDPKYFPTGVKLT